MTRKVMKLVDASTGEMECKVCGDTHFASIRPDSGGRLYRGSWQCRNGCKVPPRTLSDAIEQAFPGEEMRKAFEDAEKAVRSVKRAMRKKERRKGVAVRQV